MKRYGHLFEQIYALENLRLAHNNAKKGKGWYQEVKAVDANEDIYLERLQQMLISKTYRTSEYVTFQKTEGAKTRDIYKLPYFPDRICQWAILQVIEPYIVRNLTTDTYSAIPGRGIHQAFYKLKNAVQNDVQSCQYCLKMDVKKYYPSIDHEILKSKFRRLFKDADLLWLLDEIIDSTPGDTGIPIGNYVSQYAGNFYLSGFDHWIKEVKRVKYYFRYMDDMIFFAETKEELHSLFRDIQKYLSEELRLTVKENWQIFPTYVRGIDYVGYRIFLNFSLLRKSTCKQFKKKMTAIRDKTNAGKEMTYSEWCAINSYKGWLIHCDSHRLAEKYITPIQEAADNFYNERVKPIDKSRENT